MKEQNRARSEFVLAVLGIAVAAGCGVDKQVAAANDPVPVSTSRGAETSSAPAAAAPEQRGRGTGDDPLVVSGPLVVEHQLDLVAMREGLVAVILVEAGKRVKTGDVLAQLDDRQIHAELEAARAKTRSIEADVRNWEAEARVMQADYERAQKMWDANLIPKEQLEHAKFKAESEQWDIQRVRELLTNSKETEHGLELELEKTRILAPFDGVVARRYVREGQAVAKGDRLFWVTAEAPLRLRFTLPEKYLGRLKRGQELPLASPDLPQEKHTARVIELSPVVDPASGTIEVLVELVGSQGKLRPGMTVTVRLDNLR
ncbi:MAG: efflux RND transporter periplasmic adaptor subunit [Acidobacteriia bacterium]|nr:efflux RND transporter periplasmic adaptor subunit [Terriglobia bacterium]